MLRMLVALLGTLYAAMGLVFAVSPALVTRFIAFWEQGFRPYVIVVGLRLATGLILVAAASRCRSPVVTWWLGIIFLVSGFGALILGADVIRAMWQWAPLVPPLAIRAGAVVVAGLGAFLLYAAS